MLTFEAMNEDKDEWQTFQAVTSRRRSIRDFDGLPIDESALREVVTEALKAPSSGNLQPYQVHWVRDPGLRAALAEVCNGQRAAKSASALLVMVASVDTAKKTVEAQRRYLASSTGLSAASQAYHHQQLATFSKLLRFGSWLPLGMLRALLSFIAPVRSLLPIGPSGLRHWTTRSTVYAAQTLMLAATARGFDTCPMEGFDAPRVARLLELPRGSVIPLIIAVGHRAADARLEPQWRRPLDDALVMH